MLRAVECGVHLKVYTAFHQDVLPVVAAVVWLGWANPKEILGMLFRIDKQMIQP